jgi:hydrogenase expression/formation protein HypE
MRANQSKLSSGKLPLDILEPILESMPRGRLVGSVDRIGMDAAIVRSSGKYAVFVSGSIRGNSRNLPSRLILKLSKRMRAAGVKPLIVDPVVLFPKGFSVKDAKRVISEVNSAASKEGATIAKGHTEITPWLDKLTLVVTLIGSSSKRPRAIA